MYHHDPFICFWASRLSPTLNYYTEYRDELWCAYIFLNECFSVLEIDTQTCNFWIIRLFTIWFWVYWKLSILFSIRVEWDNIPTAWEFLLFTTSPPTQIISNIFYMYHSLYILIILTSQTITLVHWCPTDMVNSEWKYLLVYAIIVGISPIAIKNSSQEWSFWIVNMWNVLF